MRACQGCGCRLSRFAEPGDRFCAPCQPQLEPSAGALLSAARWHRELLDDDPSSVGARLSAVRWAVPP